MPNLGTPDNLKTVFMESSTDVAELEKDLEFAQISKVLAEFLVDDRDNEYQFESDHTMGKSRRISRKRSMNKQKYKAMRPWRPVGTGTTSTNLETHFVIKILSYNILAQNLLEMHKYLYMEHDKTALVWEKRMILVQEEILKAEANVICLQEVLCDHLEEFLVVFKKSGYDYIYKQRTNDKRDGLLLLYRANQLKLVEHVQVELYQPDIDILNRDNVAIVAKFSLVESPETNFIISTTHLLYNPRRNDVRLAQTQLLFAELERLAFVKCTKKGSSYLPIILCGDFNLQPHTGVYRFITEGTFEFKGRNRNLEPALLCGLGNSLIPPSLLITDNCEHYNVLMDRMRGRAETSEDVELIDEDNDHSKSHVKSTESMENKVNPKTFECQKVKVVEGRYAKFSSGSLTHPFRLNSIYKHVNNDNESEATTHQGEWVTVDYIFYSGVEPLTKYNLPTIAECLTLPTIPNHVVGSDHLCLGASFRLKKRKR
ncbi:protein angel-like isoform X2 [Venturia canescens]|nr:protein angel-like isoform X2 [Venturia canescens]